VDVAFVADSKPDSTAFIDVGHTRDAYRLTRYKLSHRWRERAFRRSIMLKSSES
jgi:hypothetical protein